MRHKLPALALAAALAASSFGASTAQASPPNSIPVTFLAAGDSYPDGAGVSGSESYPTLLGTVSYARVDETDAAASGAKTSDTVTQIAVNSNKAHSVVTVTVGANDVDWQGAIAKFASGTWSDKDQADLEDRISQLGNYGIPAVVIAAKAANRDASILVTGYPHPLGDATAGCSVLGNTVTPAQAAQINLAADGLNWAIAQSVAAAPSYSPNTNVAYVDVVPTFEGHGLCDNSVPWLQNGSPTGPAAFHPTARGQKAYAQVIQQDGFQKTALTVSRAK